MGRLRTKITAQGQVSVPAEIRRKLGVSPGSVLEWDEQDGQVVVRKAGEYTFDDIHRMLFPNGPPKPLTVEEMDEAIGNHLRKKHARR